MGWVSSALAGCSVSGEPGRSCERGLVGRGLVEPPPPPPVVSLLASQDGTSILILHGCSFIYLFVVS